MLSTTVTSSLLRRCWSCCTALSDLDPTTVSLALARPSATRSTRWFLASCFPCRSYTHFCRCGAQLDTRFEALGGRRLVDRRACCGLLRLVWRVELIGSHPQLCACSQLNYACQPCFECRRKWLN